MSIKSLIKDFIPPILTRYIQNGRKGIFGEYQTWDKAVNASGEYSPDIKTLIDNHKLYRANKSCVYNRLDSTNKVWAWCTLSGLQLAARECGNCLKVLDFGGSLGSTYFQLTDFLSSINSLKWCVVDQKECVEAGKLHFADDRLEFFLSPEVAAEKYNFDVLVLGGVLQYLPSPHKTLSNLLRNDFKFVFLDRTPIYPGSDEKIKLQQTPLELGGDLHPIRLLSEEKLMNIFADSYSLLAQHNYGPFPYNTSISNYKCFLFRRGQKDFSS